MPFLSQPKPHPCHAKPRQLANRQTTEYHTLDNENARRLWAAVMERAILDLQDNTLRGDAIEWMNSKRRSIGSFHWVCQHLDMDPDSVKRALLKPKIALSHMKRAPIHHSMTLFHDSPPISQAAQSQ
ncbi:MAG: hypothetical protein H7839_12830 [Magnetococcus sp. YQC-5]